MVTSLHALGVISMSWPLDPAVQDAYWYAFCLARLTVSSGAPVISGEVQGASSGWIEIKATAIDSDDDHVLKPVYTCHEEYLLYGKPAYRDAALLALNRSRSSL